MQHQPQRSFCFCSLKVPASKGQARTKTVDNWGAVACVYIYIIYVFNIYDVCVGVYADNDASIYTHMRILILCLITYIMARRNGSDCSAANHVLFA